MGKSSSGTKQQVTQYNASIHFGICSGPVDYISGIYVNEKEAWSGEQSVQGSITISDKMELFGGVKKEGGVQGVIEYLPGDSDQTISELLAGKVGRTTATMPAYRGITSAWFHGRNLVEPEDEGLGFYWTANSPYLPGVWIKAARASTALGETHARIYRTGSGENSTRTLTDVAAAPMDVLNGRIARFNEDLTHLIVEDTRTGDEYFSVELGYSPAWVTIVDGADVLVLKDDEQSLYVYDWTTGEEKQVLTGLPTIGFPTLSGQPSNFIEVDGSTYVFWKVYISVVCIARVSGTWFHLWTNSTEIGFLFGYGGLLAASPQYLAHKTGGDSSSPFRMAWSPGGLGTVYYATDHFATTGWDMTIHKLNSITWDALSETFSLVGIGRFLTLSEDMTTVVAWNGSTGTNASATQYPMASRHADYLGGTIITVSQESPPSYGSIAYIDADTGTVTESTPLSDWEFSSQPASGSFLEIGYDFEGSAILMHNQGGDAWVLLFPAGEFDSNPSHIIYDCLTNTDWGMGAPASAIDVTSFTLAAATLYAESFGLSMMWTKQSTIEAFISEVIDHIEATLFVSPFTGLLTLKLIRNDYSITGLDEFTPDNSVVTNWQRKLWGETVNEIVVSWTNPDNEETETVVAQDNANISAQGGIVSDGRNYYGVRVKGLAMQLAQRDLRAASTPLASCDIEVNREAWALLPGDVVILNSPEDDIVSIVMRVGPVDYGKPGDPTVKASLVEDVWALPLADYTVPPDTLAEDTAEVPTAADDTLIFTLPYFVTVNKIDSATLSGMDYPEVFAGVLASEDGQDAAEFELLGEVTDAGGNIDFANIGTKNIASRGTLPDAIDAEVETTIVSFPDRTQGSGPRIGGFMLIEGDDETEHELCLVTDWDGSPTVYTFRRGALDTVPRAWPAGTPVWFFDQAMTFTDATIRSEAETVDYKVLIRTSLGLLPEASAPVVSETLTARPHLPLRPADVTVDGDDGFSGILDLNGVDPIPTAWARRNRLTEDSVVLAWDAADVTPEAGQTTTVRLTDIAGNMLHEYTGIAGTSQNVNPADFGVESEGYIEFVAVRDALESLQSYRVRVIVSGSLFEFEDGASYEFEDDEPKLFED